MVLTAGTIYVQIIHLKIQNFEYMEPGKEIKKKKGTSCNDDNYMLLHSLVCSFL